jgi:hypothetical protein
VASEKGQKEVLYQLWDWAKFVLTEEELNNMYLVEDILGRTTWLMAAEKHQIQVLHKQLDWAKEVLTQEELSNIFLSKDGYERQLGIK